MDATQQILDDSILESEEEEEEKEGRRGDPLAKLKVFKNVHIPETELPLYLGENVLGRDPTTCSLPLPACSVSKQHTIISIADSRGNGRRGNAATEALVWDLGSMNGTRKGRLKLTPHVRYALSEGDSLVIADIPCQYTCCFVDKMADLRDKRSPGMKQSGKKDSGKRAQVGDVKEKEDSHLRESLQSESQRPQTCTDTEANVNGGAIDKTEVVGASARPKIPSQTEPVSLGNQTLCPEQTLVPESDSDSDGERERRRKRNLTFVGLESDSHRSSPTCSTFWSPTSHVIPESPVTPYSSSAEHKPSNRVVFSEEEREADLVRQQPSIKKTQVIADDSEEQREAEESERKGASPGRQAIQPIASGEPDVSAEPSNNVSVSTGNGSARGVSDRVWLELNMDSDTDVEEEEDPGAPGPAGIEVPVTLNRAASPLAHLDTDPEQFHMDSDTDLEDDETSGNVSVPKLASDGRRSPDRAPVARPSDICQDSDTDVEEQDVKSMSHQATLAAPADRLSPAQPMEFHLDSDTDVEGEEDMESRKRNSTSGTEEMHSGTAPDSKSSAAAFELHSDSEEENVDIASSKPTDFATDAKPLTALDPRAEDLEILSDSDQDEDAAIFCTPTNPVSSSTPPPLARIPLAALETAGVTTTTAHLEGPPAFAEGLSAPAEGLPAPAEGIADPADFRMDSDTDLEDEEAGLEDAGAVLIRSLPREKPPEGTTISAPPQTCSTAPALTVEEMETQAFHSSPHPFRHPFPPALRPVVSSCSDSQEDDDFVVAETQSFVLEGHNHPSSLLEDPTSLDATQAYDLDPSTRGEQEHLGSCHGSFQLGLSNSNLQAHRTSIASTQPHSPTRVDVELENTQAYGTTTSQGRAFLEGDSDQEATQLYGGGRRESSQRLGTGRQEDFALDATQAYISLPCAEGGREGEEEESTNVVAAETLPIPDDDDEDDDDEKTQPLEFPAATAAAEATPTSACEEEEDLPGHEPSVALRRGRSRGQTEKKDKEEAAQPGQGTTQQCLEDDEEEEEAGIGALRRRRARPLEEEEESQPNTSSVFLSAETQPMSSRDAEEEEEEASKQSAVKARGRPGVSSRPVRGRMTRGKKEEEELEDCSSEPPERPTREKKKAVTTVRTRRGNARTQEEESEEELDELPRRGRGRRSGKQLKQETEEQERLEREQREREEMIEGERKERAEEDRLRKEKEEMERVVVEKKERMEREMRELEEREKLKREEQERLKQEEVEEAERLEKMRKEEAERLKREEEAERSRQEKEEREEKVRLEKERGEKEEKARLEKMRKEEEAERLRQEKEKEAERLRQEKEKEAERLKQEEKEKAERLKQEEKEKAERLEKMRKEEAERLKREEEVERLRQEKEEREKKERLGQERAEKEEKARLMEEEKKRLEREERERLELQLEKEEKERMEKIKENEEQERVEQQRLEKVRMERELEKKQRMEREMEEKQRMEREVEEKQRIERELEEKQRIERELEEKQRMEREVEEKQRIERELEEKQRIERELEEKQRIERELEEKQRIERELEEKQRLEKEREEKLEMEKKEKGEREERKRQEETEKERECSKEKERRDKEKAMAMKKQKLTETEDANMASTRTRRTGRRTAADPPTAEPEPAVPPSAGRTSRRTAANPPTVEPQPAVPPSAGRTSRRTAANPPTAEPQPAVPPSTNRTRRRTVAHPPTGEPPEPVVPPSADVRRTRSRSTSVSSEQSTSSTPTQETREGGRGKAERNSSPPASADPHQPGGVSKRRKTLAATSEVKAKDVVSADVPAGRTRSRSSSTNSLSSEISTCSVASQDRGKGGGPGRKTGSTAQPKQDSHLPLSSLDNQASAPKPTARQGRSRRAEESQEAGSDVSSQPSQKAESQEPGSTRGRRRVKDKDQAPPAASAKEVQVSQEAAGASRDLQSSLCEARTSTVKMSRKRAAPVDSPSAKAARLSSLSPASSQASPASARRSRSAGLTVKVLFTGVVDEEGERVVSRLGGSMARGVADMTHLVTDKVRRTVKFLCAVAKGVPVVTPDWLDKSGKAGSFLCPDDFLVKDAEQEHKFSFCLQDSLRAASQQHLLQGYEIHVTRSVRPDPGQMKEIISCSGAHFLPKMPSAHKAQTVVVSCEEDQALCGPAFSASLPVLSAEFLLTGVLQQRVDLQAHALPTFIKPQARGRGRGRKAS